jgi:hypothetical protein
MVSLGRDYALKIRQSTVKLFVYYNIGEILVFPDFGDRILKAERQIGVGFGSTGRKPGT